MAIWQMTTFLVPIGWYEGNPEIKELHDSEGYFDSSKIWAKFPPSTSVKNIFGSTLGEVGVTRWKSKGDTDYEIDESEDGSVEGIRIRIDARNYTEGELKRILALTGVTECVLYIPEFKMIVKSSGDALDTLSYLISKSRAAEWSRLNAS